MENNKIEKKDVLHFIMDNKDDIEIMDEVAKIIFPFTTKGIEQEKENIANKEWAEDMSR